MLSGCLKQQPIVVGACLSWWKRLMLMKKQFRNSTPSTSRGYYRQYLLPHCFFPHLWHTFFAEDCGFFKNNIQTSRKVTLSLLCDAVNGHLVKVTSHFRLSDEAISGRHQGLFCPNLLAGNLMGTKKKHKKWERRLESWVQVYKSTPTVLDDACNMFNLNSGAFFLTNLLRRESWHPACKYSLSVSSFSLWSFAIQVERVLNRW